jgi:hypothetical protein
MIKAWVMKPQVGGGSGTLLASKDNWMVNASPTFNRGIDPNLILCKAGYQHSQILIAFDISGLSKVSSATLYLYMYGGDAGSKNKQCTAYRILREDWEEGTVNNSADDACWNNYKNGTAWTTAGCLGDGTDYTSANAVTSVSPASTPNWQSFNVTTLWNDAIDDSQTSLNLKIVPDGYSVDNEGLYRSREYGSDNPYIDWES